MKWIWNPVRRGADRAETGADRIGESGRQRVVDLVLPRDGGLVVRHVAEGRDARDDHVGVRSRAEQRGQTGDENPSRIAYAASAGSAAKRRGLISKYTSVPTSKPTQASRMRVSSSAAPRAAKSGHVQMLRRRKSGNVSSIVSAKKVRCRPG